MIWMDSMDFVRAVGKLMREIDPALKGCALTTLYTAVEAKIKASQACSGCQFVCDGKCTTFLDHLRSERKKQQIKEDVDEGTW